MLELYFDLSSALKHEGDDKFAVFLTNMMKMGQSQQKY